MIKYLTNDKHVCVHNKNKIKIFIFFCIFFFIRLYSITTHDFWFDEISTIEYAENPWNTWCPPVYYVLLHFWIKVFGISELSLRFPSVLFNLFSILLTLHLGTILFNKRVGMIACLIMGLSPFHLWYAQEARNYSITLFLGVGATYIFLMLLKRKSFLVWISFILISLIGLYTNYFFILLLMGYGIIILVKKRFRLNFRELTAFLLVLLGFCFYLPKFLNKLYFISNGFWIPTPRWNSLFVTLENFILGYNGSLLLYRIIDLIIVFVLGTSLVRFYQDREVRENFSVCAVIAFIPLFFTYFFSRIVSSIHLDRCFLIFSPYFYLLIAVGIDYFKRTQKIISIIILISLLIIGIYRYFNDIICQPLEHRYGTYIKRPIRPLVSYLNERMQPTDILAFTNDSAMPSVLYYMKGKEIPYYYFFNPQYVYTHSQRPFQENDLVVPIAKINSLSFERLWVISSNYERNGLMDNNCWSVKIFLAKQYNLTFYREFDGVWLFRYERQETT
ncbi:MAG: glycosyltransferase family 39 protein [Candidatus Omnitrophica bacterium]|nr:glycosyltransferase family 39 protein [Candidatus Omnitrophota bacterium]